MTNNTSGASIYDLGNIIKADSIAEVSDILKDSEAKQQQQQQAQMQSQEKMQQEQIAAQKEQQEAERAFRVEEAEKERQKDLMVAEIRAAGYGAQTDLDQNQMSDFRDSMKEIRQTEQYREQMDFKKDESLRRQSLDNQKMEIEREKMMNQRDIANTQLEIARENKNKYDDPKPKERKKGGEK